MICSGCQVNLTNAIYVTAPTEGQMCLTCFYLWDQEREDLNN